MINCLGRCYRLSLRMIQINIFSFHSKDTCLDNKGSECNGCLNKDRKCMDKNHQCTVEGIKLCKKGIKTFSNCDISSKELDELAYEQNDKSFNI